MKVLGMIMKYYSLFNKYSDVIPEVVQLIDTAVKAVEDKKISKAEQSALMKEYWRVINKIRRMDLFCRMWSRFIRRFFKKILKF